MGIKLPSFKRYTTSWLGVGVFVLIYMYLLIRYLCYGESDAIWFIFIISFPTSHLLLSQTVVDWLLGFGYVISTTIEWIIILISGLAQYWVIGILIKIYTQDSNSETDI